MSVGPIFATLTRFTHTTPHPIFSQSGCTEASSFQWRLDDKDGRTVSSEWSIPGSEVKTALRHSWLRTYNLILSPPPVQSALWPLSPSTPHTTKGTQLRVHRFLIRKDWTSTCSDWLKMGWGVVWVKLESVGRQWQKGALNRGGG